MGYRERIEVAVIAMFDTDRRLSRMQESMGSDTGIGWVIKIDMPSHYETAMDALFMNKEAKEGDLFLDLWHSPRLNGQEFIDACYKYQREAAEARGADEGEEGEYDALHEV